MLRFTAISGNLVPKLVRPTKDKEAVGAPFDIAPGLADAPKETPKPEVLGDQAREQWDSY